MVARVIDVVIVGAGQAGLAVAHYLRRSSCRFVVYERGRVGESWRSQRWDSLVVNTPNWMNDLPGARYEGTEPKAFCSRNAFLDRLERCASALGDAVQTGVSVRSLMPSANGFEIRIERQDGTRRTVRCRHVVVASGFFRRPKLPRVRSKVPDWIVQIHSSAYRNASRLPAGAVLVVGSGQSGCQIAEDLLEAGRRVYLSTSRVARVPRRYRGRDTFEWFSEMGVFDQRIEDLDDPRAGSAAQFLISGEGDRGHTLSLQQLARHGIHLAGRLIDFRDGRLWFDSDTARNIRYGDRTSNRVKRAIDRYATGAGVPAAEWENDPADIPDRSFESITFPSSIDPEEHVLRSIVWCTGYAPDFDWIRLPAFGADGKPLQRDGRSVVPGLYFAGLPWLRCRKSGLIYGVDEDARTVVEAIVARLHRNRRPPAWVTPARERRRVQLRIGI